jgi:hypothetical protein
MLHGILILLGINHLLQVCLAKWDFNHSFFAESIIMINMKEKNKNSYSSFGLQSKLLKTNTIIYFRM